MRLAIAISFLFALLGAYVLYGQPLPPGFGAAATNAPAEPVLWPVRLGWDAAKDSSIAGFMLTVSSPTRNVTYRLPSNAVSVMTFAAPGMTNRYTLTATNAGGLAGPAATLTLIPSATTSNLLRCWTNLSTPFVYLNWPTNMNANVILLQAENRPVTNWGEL